MVMRQFTAAWSRRWLVLVALAFGQFASSATAQEFGGFGGFGVPTDGFGASVEFAASFDIAEGKRTGELKVTATLSDPWYIHSVTQPAGGPLKTEIEFKGDQCKLAGPFQPNHPPKVIKSSEFKGVLVEKHYGNVVWTAPIELAEGVDPTNVKLVLVINGQTCIDNGSCKPLSDQEVEVSFAGFLKAPAPVADEAYRDPDAHVSWRVEMKPATLPPGGKGELIITGTPEGDYHVYSMVVEDKETKFRTLLVLDQKGDLKVSRPQPEQAPVTEVIVPNEPPVSFHKGEVKWRVPFEVPGEATEGKRIISGMVGYQACDDKSCDQPLAFSFRGEVDINSNSGGGSSSLLALAKVGFAEVADHPQRLEWFKSSAVIESTASEESDDDVAAVPVVTMDAKTWITYVGMALLGGFILNFMPCVLPVIGLKIMGFAQKGKQDVHRIEVLDFWFILGILSVLWGLAVITIAANAASSQFNWGEQFTITWFKVTLAMIVFAMALSFLGVWEIPIPGFAQTKKSGELMQQEGAVGAFFKGFFTTLLATPCSGPFLGLVFGACIGQPWWVVLSLFTAIGLGLSSPYIVIAINPRLLFWLPKPGPWMNTLKEIMAFPLLFTVVFLISTINRDFRIATFALLTVVWLACWLIGKVPGYAPLASQAKAWGAGVAMIAVSAWAFFNFLGPIDKHIDWQPFSEAKLAQLRSEGKTVLIDFTADWCLTCKVNLAVAIETEDVSGLIKKNKVVPLLADWTDSSPEIKKKLKELKSASIPLLAIYPPDAAPIILRDSLFESDVLKALKDAGPSKGDKTPTASVKEKLQVTPAKL